MQQQAAGKLFLHVIAFMVAFSCILTRAAGEGGQQLHTMSTNCTVRDNRHSVLGQNTSSSNVQGVSQYGCYLLDLRLCRADGCMAVTTSDMWLLSCALPDQHSSCLVTCHSLQQKCACQCHGHASMHCTAQITAALLPSLICPCPYDSTTMSYCASGAWSTWSLTCLECVPRGVYCL